MRWTRANKAELARQIAELLAQNLSYRQIADRVGKTRRRVLQVVKLFSLRDRTFVR